jgi:hypothetical protein
MNAQMASSLNYLDVTGTCPDVKPRRALVRERYQDVKVKDFGDKWRIDYWDYTTTPRRKRGKKWLKENVPTKREAQKHADEFMEQVNERNNSPQFCSNDGDTFASLAKMYREKISCHLKNSIRMNYDFYLDAYLIPKFGDTRLNRIRWVASGGVLAGHHSQPSRESAALLEGCTVADGCDRGGSSDRSDSGDRDQAPALFKFAADARDQLVGFLDLPVPNKEHAASHRVEGDTPPLAGS